MCMPRAAAIAVWSSLLDDLALLEFLLFFPYSFFSCFSLFEEERRKAFKESQNKDKESFSREATPSVVYLKGTKQKKLGAVCSRKRVFVRT